MKKTTKIAACGLALVLTLSSVITAKTKLDANGNSVSFWKELLLGKQKYVEYDDVDLQTNNVFQKKKERQSTMIYNPVTKKAGVSTYFETMFFNFVFSYADRQLIIKGVESYLDDFENKRLIHNKNKSTKMYGRGKCFAEYGTVKIMMNHESDTTFSVGYRFEKKTPYFVVSIRGAKDQAENQSTYAVKEFPTVTMYFTRAQAKDFAEKLGQDQLDVLQADYDEKIAGAQNRVIKEKDDYNEKNADVYEE
ncbi:hypothetical protein [Treponema sp. C6A8]|uniref:hypothetical protein n=1 Tax=Treponema sp. C6A8 TaxID=1410609 RepID=UPI0004897D52|nr:hypothetical protein [Treponema sp. C6A8]